MLGYASYLQSSPHKRCHEFSLARQNRNGCVEADKAGYRFTGYGESQTGGQR
jgi:hypothetical protein